MFINEVMKTVRFFFLTVIKIKQYERVFKFHILSNNYCGLRLSLALHIIISFNLHSSPTSEMLLLFLVIIINNKLCTVDFNLHFILHGKHLRFYFFFPAVSATR